MGKTAVRGDGQDKNGQSRYRRGTEKVLPVRNNSYSCTLVSAAVVERLESHPSKTEGMRPACGRQAPGSSTALVWVAWKGVPAASSRFQANIVIEVNGVDRGPRTDARIQRARPRQF
jgi:hypothetical protein